MYSQNINTVYIFIINIYSNSLIAPPPAPMEASDSRISSTRFGTLLPLRLPLKLHTVLPGRSGPV